MNKNNNLIKFTIIALLGVFLTLGVIYGRIYLVSQKLKLKEVAQVIIIDIPENVAPPVKEVLAPLPPIQVPFIAAEKEVVPVVEKKIVAQTIEQAAKEIEDIKLAVKKTESDQVKQLLARLEKAEKNIQTIKADNSAELERVNAAKELAENALAKNEKELAEKEMAAKQLVEKELAAKELAAKQLAEKIRLEISKLPTNIIYMITSQNITSKFSSVIKALKATKSKSRVIIMPGIYAEKNAGADWLAFYKQDIKIIGLGNPKIQVQSKNQGYQIGLQLPKNEYLSIEGITVENIATVNNNHLIYNTVLTGNKHLLVSNCTFKTTLLCTNSVLNNFVILNSDDVKVISSHFEVIDKTGKNMIFQCATHGSKDTISFTNCTFKANNMKKLCTGPGHFYDCYGDKEYDANGFIIKALQGDK